MIQRCPAICTPVQVVDSDTSVQSLSINYKHYHQTCNYVDNAPLLLNTYSVQTVEEEFTWLDQHSGPCHELAFFMFFSLLFLRLTSANFMNAFFSFFALFCAFPALHFYHVVTHEAGILIILVILRIIHHKLKSP